MRDSLWSLRLNRAFASRLYLACFALSILFSMPAAHGGAITTQVTTNVTFLTADQIAVRGEIGNNGDDTAYSTTVTTFLGNDARQSGVLGENKPGGVLRYNCDFDGSILKPGQYILMTRVNFMEKNGTPHRIFHFTPFVLRSGEVKSKPALTVAVDTQAVNLKSFLTPKGHIRLSLKNGHKNAIEPVIFFALPDGLKMDEGERSFHVAPGEEKAVEIPITVTATTEGNIPYNLIVRYEDESTQHMQQAGGIIRGEERPVLFKLFLLVGVVVLIYFAGTFLYRRKRHGQGA